MYDYDGVTGTVDERRIFADTSQVGGSPDGACADADGGVWSCILGPGTVVRYTVDGQDAAIDVGVELPSDITFGGPSLDAMFVTTIASNPDPSIARGGQLLVIADSGYRGVPEPRFRL
ncbi:MAG TPA: SMP-30/gluconolactonase/LRE family protein [Acidimicrobiales bacterium]|nr:SMP-30/gluconolactonase/LRE family protein [Acidimicrobiales bacterium]